MRVQPHAQPLVRAHPVPHGGATRACIVKKAGGNVRQDVLPSWKLPVWTPSLLLEEDLQQEACVYVPTGVSPFANAATIATASPKLEDGADFWFGGLFFGILSFEIQLQPSRLIVQNR